MESTVRFLWSDLTEFRYCKKCKLIKPPRAHHCSLCERCILKMDHHCPWVGSCVGFSNHKFFMQFLTYTTFGCMFSALTMGFYTMNLPDSMMNSEGQRLSLASLLSAVLIIAIGILWFTHFYFIWTSMSSIESGGLM